MVQSYTLEVPGGVLVYDVHEPTQATAQRPPLLMIGHPMGAGGFSALAAHFTDRAVVTYDPRGIERSVVPDAEHTPERNAEDVHLIIEAIGGGAVDVFGSSGGALTGLALVALRPEDVRVLVAHEPPLLKVLPDADLARQAFRQVTQDYHEKGFGAGMARFIALTSVQGELTAELLAQPAPDPAMFGLPTHDDGARDNPLLSGVSDPVTEHPADLAALAAAPTSVVVAAGVESRQQVPGRAAAELAKLLATDLVMFPSHHGGFVGGEGGYAGQPEAFAATLRDVLDA